MGCSFSGALATHIAFLGCGGQGVESLVVWACGCSSSCSNRPRFTGALEGGAATLGLWGVARDVVWQVMLLFWNTVGVGEMASNSEPHSFVFDSP